MDTKLYHIFISDLRNKLAESLPGRGAQSAMAPSLRPNIHPSGRRYGIKRQSAVMILIYPEADELKFVCIKRPEYDGPHGGQISLPGGKYDLSDKDLVTTAVRETFEEVGVMVRQSEIMGQLTKLYIPVSNIDVNPYVALIPEKPLFIADEKEVDYLIEISLSQLMDSRNIYREKRMIAHQMVTVPYFLFGEEKIWGATAMILSEFLAVLSKLDLLNEHDSRKYFSSNRHSAVER